MFNKLYKHELASYLRNWLPVQVIVLGIALLNRFVQFFESDSTVYSIVFGSSTVAYVLALIVSMVLTGILCIVRFYKNLFTGEGYLSFTLPVTPGQHIWAKLLSAVTVEILTTVTVLISVCIISAGELFVEILKALKYVIDNAYATLGVHFPLYCAEFILLIIIASATTSLLVYGCIALGQTFNKNRIAWAVGIYFIYYMITQILSTVFTTVITLIYDKLPLEGITAWITQNQYASIHIGFGVLLLIQLILATVFFLVTHYIIKRKLNLE